MAEEGEGMKVGEVSNAIRRALDILDKWNDCVGVVQKHTGYYYEMQGVVEDAVHCGIQGALKEYRKLESEE
jgi:hypothetical protein